MCNMEFIVMSFDLGSRPRGLIASWALLPLCWPDRNDH